MPSPYRDEAEDSTARLNSGPPPLAPARPRPAARHGRPSAAIAAAMALLVAAGLAACASEPGSRAAFSQEALAPEALAAALRAAPDALDYLADAVARSRVVFLAESHDEVGAVLFLARSLRAFHDAGVRVLFLESGLKPLLGTEGYGFVGFYPWTLAGWKYEWEELSLAVAELNAGLPEGERLRVLRAEAGFEFDGKGAPEEVPALLNGRDAFAYGTIAAAVEAAGPGEKVLVFYGGAHGSKTVRRGYSKDGSPRFDWATLGSRLEARYGEGFLSFDYRSASDFFPGAADGAASRADDSPWSGAPSGRRILPPGRFAGTPYRDAAGRYDACVVDASPVYGVFYEYVPTAANLEYMAREASRLYAERDAWKDDDAPFRFSRRGQFLLLAYYLRLHLGDAFPYSFWNGEAGFDEAITAAGQPPAAPGPGMDALREYHRLMREADVEGMLAGRETDYGRQATLLTRAASLYPADLWARYWLAYARTREGRWAEALADWELVLGSPLSRCMETLPEAYALAAECCRRLGSRDRARFLELEGAALRPDSGIRASGFPDAAPARR